MHVVVVVVVVVVSTSYVSSDTLGNRLKSASPLSRSRTRHLSI